MRVLFIVPAYNEAASIAQVVASLHEQHAVADVLVVDDGSTDGTGAVAEKTGQARVIRLPVNLGIGGAVQTGFKLACREGYDAAVQFDGDGQHLASEIDSLLAPLVSDQADVVIGSRFGRECRGFKSTRTRWLGIKFFAMVNSLLIGQRISDNTSGFRAYNAPALRFLTDYYPVDYPEPEAVILLGKNGFRLREVPVRMRARQGGVSSIRGVRSVYYMMKVFLGILMGTLRPKVRRG
ncbi:MAG TPA: glycosyltransferase family 2 protein [Candidatus Aminicenantes bacterium]|nr:glycosyltransferase family 2 protein [Candidatus Aminicenantes bacterium]